MIPRASAAKAKDKKRLSKHPYVAVVDGAEISFMNFKTHDEALAYARKVAALRKQPDEDGRLMWQRMKRINDRDRKRDHV